MRFLTQVFALAVVCIVLLLDSGQRQGVMYIGIGVFLLYVGLPLVVLYATVRFIKWSWNH